MKPKGIIYVYLRKVSKGTNRIEEDKREDIQNKQ